MFAILESGGKQYRVSEGDSISVEHLSGDVGEQVSFKRVLLVHDDENTHVGTPTIDGARVLGTITEQGKGEKVVVFKFKRRKKYRRKKGHRQLFTRVQIEDIEYPLKQDGKKQKAKTTAKEATEEKPARKTAKKKTSKKAAKKSKKTGKKASKSSAKTSSRKKKTSKKSSKKSSKKTTEE